MHNVTGTVVGLLGGGQLGKMLAFDAHRLGIKIVALDPDPNCPCSGVVDKLLVGHFKDPEQVLRLRNEGCSVVTVEIEHINVDSLDALVKSGVNVQPSPSTLRIIQDKLLQKIHLQKHGLPVAPFEEVPSVDSLKSVISNRFGLPFVLKARKLAYDGRGNAVIRSIDEVAPAFQSLGSQFLYAEKWVNFVKELSVMVARFLDGTIVTYPVVETIHKENICHLVFAPAQIRPDVAKSAAEIAKKAISTFEGAGIFAVELFLTSDNAILINEIAPRPHNSGHFSIEACTTSQYETHLRAITGLPPGDTSLNVGAAGMVNVLGSGEGNKEMEKTLRIIERALWVPGARAHWYGKTVVKRNRKMGHITVVGNNMTEVIKRLGMLEIDINEKIHPVVGIIMGSDSDLPKMKPAAEILQKFEIPFEITIVSAHRTPDRMFEYARSADSRGIRIIIAGAGGAAHLPGMVASLTPLPVIGVPIRIEPLDGTDSLYSIVQMPRGVPVATVAINNATNAALLAVRMIGTYNPLVREKMEKYQEEMKEEVLKKVDKLGTVGWHKY